MNLLNRIGKSALISYTETESIFGNSAIVFSKGCLFANWTKQEMNSV